MKCFVNTDNFYINVPTVLTIGKFDGEHIGHQKIFSAMRDIAESKGLKTAIFTFHTPPAFIVEGAEDDYVPLSTDAERNRRLENFGIDYMVEYPFNSEISKISGEDFIKDILVARMNMKAIVGGEDCAFGYNKSGNAALLRKLSKELGYDVYIIEKQRDANEREISSSLIRSELKAGNIENVNGMLGSKYSISGKVLRGNRIGGRLLGFPTVNIFPEQDKFLPRFGVYFSKVRIEGEDKLYRGITNIGVNPTVKKDKKNHIPRVETYLYNFNRNLYGKKIEVSLYKFLRGEMKFDTLEELKSQIEKDKKEGENWFNNPESIDIPGN